MMIHRHYISRNAEDYLMQQFPADTAGWIRDFDTQVQYLCDKWQIALSGYEDESRFGTILYGSSSLYGEVALKIVPWFSPRLQGEIFCYRNLPYRQMCRLHDSDERVGALLLKYIPGMNALWRNMDEDALAGMFRDLYTQRKPAAGLKGEVCRYRDAFDYAVKCAREQVFLRSKSELLPLIRHTDRACAAIEELLNADNYLIHGDAHEFNILMQNGGCVLIDPLGFIAPFEFEYARYLGTYIKERHPDCEKFCRVAQNMLQPDSDLKRVLTAFAVDTTMRSCNTFIEGNTDAEIRASVAWASDAWKYADDICRS